MSDKTSHADSAEARKLVLTLVQMAHAQNKAPTMSWLAHWSQLSVKTIYKVVDYLVGLEINLCVRKCQFADENIHTQVAVVDSTHHSYTDVLHTPAGAHLQDDGMPRVVRKPDYPNVVPTIAQPRNVLGLGHGVYKTPPRLPTRYF